jgi:hypothetical protein
MISIVISKKKKNWSIFGIFTEENGRIQIQKYGANYTRILKRKKH